MKRTFSNEGIYGSFRARWSVQSGLYVLDSYHNGNDDREPHVYVRKIITKNMTA